MHQLSWMFPDAIKSLCVRCSSSAYKATECDAFASRSRLTISKTLQATYDRLKPTSYSTKLVRSKDPQNRSASHLHSHDRNS